MTQVQSRLASPESVGMSAGRLERVGPALQKHVDERGCPVPLAEDTIYRLCSMTKPIVCAALMTLFAEGKFQLVDPVATWIPAFAATEIAGPGGTLEDQSPLRPMQIRDVAARRLRADSTG